MAESGGRSDQHGWPPAFDTRPAERRFDGPRRLAAAFRRRSEVQREHQRHRDASAVNPSRDPAAGCTKGNQKCRKIDPKKLRRITWRAGQRSTRGRAAGVKSKRTRAACEYQRGQESWARKWGWSPEHIKFYVDAGLSGTAAAHRPQFLSMLDDVKAKRLRAIFAANQSRLARNAVEWITFLELCRINHVLLVLDGRIIQLKDDGDAFSSSVVALVDEFENRKRRAVFERGRLGKIAAGKAVSSPPTGYVARKDGGWDLDPDTEVQLGIAEVFRVFLEERSSSRTIRRLLAAGRRIPRRMPGREVRWRSPTVRSVLVIVRNPAYTGHYVFRRRVVDEARGRDRRGHARIRIARPQEMMEIRDHHPPYISQQNANEIFAILRMNAPTKNRRNLGPGASLLQGIIGCEKHSGRAMSVDYKGDRPDGETGAHYYHCHGLYEVGGPQCWAVPGKQGLRAASTASGGKEKGLREL